MPRLCSFFAAALWLALLAAPANAQPLNVMLEQVLASNPQLAAAQAAMRVAEQTPREARSAFFPRLNAQASYGQKEDETTTLMTSSMENGAMGDGAMDSSMPQEMTSETSTNPLTAGVSLQQYVYAGGRLLSGLGEANETYTAARQRFLQTRQNVLLAALTAYFDVIRDQAIYRSNEGNVDLIGERLLLARRRNEVGELTRTDVAQAQARYALAQAQLAAARSALATSRAAFERISGEPPGLLLFPPLPRLPTDREASFEFARASHPSLAAAKADARAAIHGVGSAYANFMPSISIEGSYAYAEEPSAQVEDNISASISAVLTVPLFAGGQGLAQLARAKAQADARRYEALDARRAIEENLENSWTRYEAASARLVFAQEQERASEVALDSVQREAELGTRTTLDTLDAAQELLDARVSHQESRRDQQVAAYALLAAVGLLTPQQLELGATRQ